MRDRTRIIMIALCLILAVSVFFAAGYINSTVRLSLNGVCSIEGTLIYDSSISRNGNRVYKVRLKSCTNKSGNSASASGTVTVISREDIPLSCGTGIWAEGKVSGNLFIAKNVVVTNKTSIQSFREKLIMSIERRLLGGEVSDGGLLGLALLLGRTESWEFDLKDKAGECGCLHVLALSGMHLQTLALMCSLICGKRKWGKVLGFAVVSAFLFVAGPRPSLVRAYLMFLMNFMCPEESLVLAFLIHCLIFPFQVTDLGFYYGYGATFALVFVSPFIRKIFRPLMNEKLASVMASSFSAVLVTCPIQIINEGMWHLSALVVSPIAVFLIKCSMMLGLVSLVTGPFIPVNRALDFLYRVLENLFRVFESWPEFGFTMYIVVLVCLAVLFAVLKAVQHSSHFIERMI